MASGGERAKAVQEALALVKGFASTRFEERFDGDDEGPQLVVNNPQNESLHRDRMKRLQNSLAQSKQRVVQHLIQARQIQRSILQSEIVENAVKAHMEAKSHELAISKMSNGSRKSSGSKKVWYDNSTLLQIDTAANLEYGTACTIQRAFHRYDDGELCDELENFSPADFPDGELTTALFTNIVVAASSLKIAETEAGKMFRFGEAVFVRMRQPPQNLEERWQIFSNILRKKLQLLFLAAAIGGQSSVVSTSTTLLQRTLPPPPETTIGLSSPSMTSLSQSSSTISKKATSLLIRSNNKSLVAMTSPESLEQHDPKQAFGKIAAKFQKSQQKQEEIADRIVSNLSLVSQQVSFGGRGEDAHKSAVAFAKRMSVRKIEQILKRVAKRTQAESWRRWLVVVAAGVAEDKAKVCMQHLGALRIFQGLETCLNSKLARALKNFKARVMWLGGNERLAAVIEVQRYWRGCLNRLRRWHLVRKYAATLIQSATRRKIARRVVRYRRMHEHFKSSVRKIEKAYMQFRWKLIGRNIREFKIQQNMAANIQRVFRGYLGRRRVRKIRLRIRRIRGATKMQSLWRRYKATLRVDKLSTRRKRLRAAAKIQSVARGMIGRIRAARIKEIYTSARKIQCLVRCRRARKEHLRRLRWRSAIRIQRIARGRQGRKRFQIRKERHLAYLLNRRVARIRLVPYFLGWRTRRVWLPRVRKHVARRRAAIIVIQKWMRRSLAQRRVAKIRHDRAVEAARIAKELADEEFQRMRRLKAAGKIQRVMRGVMARKRVRVLRVAYNLSLDSKRERMKHYWRLKEDYYRDQNMFHRPFLLKIQCFFRTRRAVWRVRALRRQRAARNIQRAWARFKAIRAAKRRAAKLRYIRLQLNLAATDIQKIVRGFMGRYEFKRHEMAEINKWFLHEIKSLGLIGKALQNFRIRKRTLERINRLVIKAQALIRRFLVRCKFIRGHKRLVREREARRRARRVRACTIIQGFARIIKAKKVVAKRRKLVEEERKLKRSMDELEGRIDGMHGNLMTDLLAAKAQSGVRAMLGKKAKEKRVVDLEAEAKKSVAQKRKEAATKIQALARGVASRLRFKKVLPALAKERQMRSFCVECEASVATRRCRQCKDRYCDMCYSKIHKKGARRQHSWDPVIISHADAKQMAKLDKKSSNAAAPVAAATKQSTPAFNKRDWEKFWDGAAKAHYWFNQTTGEAQWVPPEGWT